MAWTTRSDRHLHGPPGGDVRGAFCERAAYNYRGRRPPRLDCPIGDPMNKHAVLRHLRLGEDGRVEFKEARVSGTRVKAPKRDDLADELAAFANADGGFVLLGVEDRPIKVVGVPRPGLDALEELVRGICNDAIQPPLPADIRRMELPDAAGVAQPVLLVGVPRSLFVHASRGRYLRRIGSSKRRLDPMALQRLMMLRTQSGVISFDESPVPRTTPDDLDRSAAERCVSGEADFDLAVRKLALIVKDPDGADRLSVAGALMCTPEPQQWLPAAYIQAVFYVGNRIDRDYQTDAADLGGPLDVQIREACHFVRRNMRTAAVKDLGRIDVPQYSERAVFEAVVNAVAHRDYSMGSSRIRLHLFADRLELMVPGELANSLTPDALHLRQASRNQLIASLLARFPGPGAVGRQKLMDQRGDGVPRIREETRTLSGRLPEYAIVAPGELRLVIPAANPFG